MIRILYFPPEGGFLEDKTVDHLPELMAVPEAVTWLDFDQVEPADAGHILAEVFRFHPLAVEDALHDINVAKLDDWGDYLYLALHGMTADDQGDINFHELDIFLGPNYFITYHEEALAAVDRLWEKVQLDQRYPARRPDRLLYRLADELMIDYSGVLDRLELRLDDVEQEVFRDPHPDTMGFIFHLKRNLQEMRRHISPQREIYNKLARDEFKVVAPADRVFFRDLYDQSVRVHELIEGQRDLVNGAMELYLSAVNNRMNDIMKTLTVITTMFLPLSFITGFFGMNFFQPVFATTVWTGVAAFSLVLLALIALPVGMYTYMRRRHWV